MATGMNHELHTLQNYKSAIISKIATQVNPEWFSLKLQEKGMISAKNASAIVDNLTWSKEGKVNRLIQAVESELEYGDNPAQIFKKFIEILSSESVLKDLVQKLQKEYECRQIPNSEDDEPENDDISEKNKLIEEGRRYKQTQIKQESGSDQPCEIRCTLPGRNNPCIMLACCYGGLFSLILSAVACIEISLKSENSDLKLRWDIEKGSSGSYSRDDKLAMEQELVLWLSCFIICTPWILTQYIPNDKWKNMTRLSLAVYSLLVLVGILYFVKDFECFKIGILFFPAVVSFDMTVLISFQICFMCYFDKTFCLRLYLSLLTLTVAMVFFEVMFYCILHIKVLHIESLCVGLFYSFALEAIFAISAKILAVYDRGDTLNRNLALYLSILGVGSSVLLSISLLLKISLDDESLYAALLLLPTNLVLLTATTLVPRLPQNFPAYCGYWKWFKAIVVYCGLFVGVRNLLLEVLVVWRTF